MKRFIFLLCIVMIACNAVDSVNSTKKSLEEIEKQYANKIPKLWGEDLQGITKNLSDKNAKSNQKIIYLTFDACGGDYDKNLIDFLIKNNINATLFINARWIHAHKDEFIKLAKNPLFSIQNHGTNHKPLSINGKEIYGIKGTDSIKEVYDEIMQNDKLIRELSGKNPTYFRSGTAYYDEVAISIAKDLGYSIGGFDVLGDGGATFSKEKIIAQENLIKNGSIIIYHFNKPKSHTLQGLKVLIPKLQQKGFSFGLL